MFLGSVINAVVSQVIVLLRERGLQLIHDIPEEVKSLIIHGDQARIQQILSDFLLSMVRHAPSSPDGWVEIQVRPIKDPNADSEPSPMVHTEFRYITGILLHLISHS